MPVDLTKCEPAPRFKGCPPVCLEANLPSHETEAASLKFNTTVGAEHPAPVLVRWKCRHCGGWHHWPTAHTDNSGSFKGGADVVPAHVKKLVRDSDPEKFFALAEKEVRDFGDALKLTHGPDSPFLREETRKRHQSPRPAQQDDLKRGEATEVKLERAKKPAAQGRFM
jgi:hypothetical protein